MKNMNVAVLTKPITRLETTAMMETTVSTTVLGIAVAALLLTRFFSEIASIFEKKNKPCYL